MTFQPRYTPAQLAAHEAHKARQARMSVGVTPVATLPAPPVSEAPKPLVRQVEEERRRPPTIHEIGEAVGEHYKVRFDDIKSERRTKNVIRPRFVTAYLAKELTGFSYPRIGRAIGGRDHTTIWNAIQSIEGALKFEPELVETISVLKKKLQPAAKRQIPQWHKDAHGLYALGWSVRAISRAVKHPRQSVSYVLDLNGERGKGIARARLSKARIRARKLAGAGA